MLYKEKLKEDSETFRKTNQEKYGKNSPDGGEQKTLVDVKDTSCSLMIWIPTNEWDDLPSPGLIFCQTLSQEVLQTEPVIDKTKEPFLHNKVNVSVIFVVDTILASETESGVDGNWCLLDNKSSCNAFINVKYISNIRNSSDGQYICVHCNARVNYPNKIADLPGY